MIQRRGPEKNKPNASTRREVRCNGGLVSRLHPGCARCRDHVMAQSLRQSGPGNASARSNSSLATDLSMVGLTGADQRWMVAHVNQRFFLMILTFLHHCVYVAFFGTSRWLKVHSLVGACGEKCCSEVWGVCAVAVGLQLPVWVYSCHGSMVSKIHPGHIEDKRNRLLVFLVDQLGQHSYFLELFVRSGMLNLTWLLLLVLCISNLHHSYGWRAQCTCRTAAAMDNILNMMQAVLTAQTRTFVLLANECIRSYYCLRPSFRFLPCGRQTCTNHKAGCKTTVCFLQRLHVCNETSNAGWIFTMLRF